MMKYIICSVILFGLIHPLSKLILDSGIDLYSFCFLFVFIRLLVQLPFFIYFKSYKNLNKKSIFNLIAIGLIGSFLQLSEFYSIKSGIPVPVVSFLVFLHPLWTTLFGLIFKIEKISKEKIFKIILAFIGTLIIFSGQFQSIGNILHLIPAILAGVLLSSWIIFSGKAKKQGLNNLQISFSFDLISSITLFSIWFFSHNYNPVDTLHWLNKIQNISFITLYSILIGLIPNLLFYKSVNLLSPISVGLIMLFEPIISTFFSVVLLEDNIGINFFVGSIFIIAANIPKFSIFQR
jgi:drug/metabolite transporter (DMT)-like permease